MAVENIIWPKNLKKIGSSAFNGCTSLFKVNLPDSVIELGDSVFASCKNLESIYFPNSVTDIGTGLFNGCTNLKIVKLSEQLTALPQYTFSGCSSLETLDIPSTVKRIGSKFIQGTQISEITIPKDLEEIIIVQEWNKNNGHDFPVYPFDGNDSISRIIFADGVKKIPANLCRNCTVTEVVIPSSVKEIEDVAFYCSGLKKLELPDGVEKLGGSAFDTCRELTDVVMADSVKEIGISVFDRCEKLQNVRLSNNISYLPQYAFSSCTSLAELTLPEKLTGMGQRIIQYTAIKELTIPKGMEDCALSGDRWHEQGYPFTNATELEKVEFESGMKRVPAYIFRDAAIKEVVFPDTIKEVGTHAFCGTKITTVDLPTSLTKIEDNAFSYSALTAIILPYSVTSVGTNAFRNCKDLVSAELSINLEKISGSMFYDCNALKTVRILGGTTRIEEYAFGNTNLSGSITLPGGIEYIGKYAFVGCSSLTSVEIAKSIKWLPKVEQIIATEVQDKNKEVHTMDLSWTLGKGDLLQIDKFAFQNCTGLLKVKFNNEIGSIASNAFSGCSSLANVEIAATEEQWEKISKYSTELSGAEVAYLEILNNMTGSEIQISVDDTFDEYQEERVNYAREHLLKARIDAKEKVGKYFIRIRAYGSADNTIAYGKWSDTVALEVKNFVTEKDVLAYMEKLEKAFDSYYKAVSTESKAELKNYEDNYTTKGKILREADEAQKAKRMITFDNLSALSEEEINNIYGVLADLIEELKVFQMPDINLKSKWNYKVNLQKNAINICNAVYENLEVNSQGCKKKTTSGLVQFKATGFAGSAEGIILLRNKKVGQFVITKVKKEDEGEKEGKEGEEKEETSDSEAAMVLYLKTLSNTTKALMYESVKSILTEMVEVTGFKDAGTELYKQCVKEMDDMAEELVTELMKNGFGKYAVKFFYAGYELYDMHNDVKEIFDSNNTEEDRKKAVEKVYNKLKDFSFSDETVQKGTIKLAQKELEDIRKDTVAVEKAYLKGDEMPKLE